MTVTVIDANVWISTVIPTDYSGDTISKMKKWGDERVRIVVPSLWHYEVVSGLRKAIALKLIPSENAMLALDALQLMAFEEVMPSDALDRLALEWADRLGQVVAYDAQYLALAENLGCDLWTADKRLVNNARQKNAPWVRWVGEE